MTQIKLRRDTSANFTSKNPILGNGEPAYETDTKKLKIGDGTTAYTQLEYFSAGGGGSTNISATLPLKIVDGVISLEVDGQTIQVVDGKLHANLDELGNEVNSLTGEVTDLTGRVSANEANISAMKTGKQDKLTAGTGIKIEKNVISNTQTSTEWGDIQGNITAQEDLQNTLNTKVDKVEGKSLILDTEIERLKGVHNYDDTQIKKDITNINSALKTKASTTDLQNGLKTKQDKLTFDTTPTANSSNPVTSGGIKTALDKKVNSTTLTAELAKKQNTLVSGTNIKTINGQSVLGGGNITVGDSAPANMVTTDTAQTITGSKTFNGTVTLKSAKIGNQISALQVPLYVDSNTATLTPIVQSFTDLDNPVSELRFGSINNKLEVRGSEVVDKNNKKFLTQGNITGTGNITITETADGIQITCDSPTNTQFTTLQNAVAGKADITNVWTLSTVGSTSTPLTWGASGSRYISPANGRFFIEASSFDKEKYVRLYCTKNSINRISSGNAAAVIAVDIPVDAGDEVFLFHNLSEDPSTFKFVYANGG